MAGITKGCADSGLQASEFIGYGSVTVEWPDSYYLQDETGDFITDEAGNRILGDVPSPYQLDTAGNIILDQDGSPIVDEDWRLKVVTGIATPLDTISPEIQAVTVQAKTTNLGKIWVSSAIGRGVYLSPGSTGSVPLRIGTKSLTTVYIIGNAGEGVNFFYETNDDTYLTFLGAPITSGGEEVTFTP